MTVYIKGKPIKLDPSDAKGKGGEADVYSVGMFYSDKRTIAVKLFKTPDHPDYANLPHEQKGAEERLEIHQRKLRAFPKNLPDQVVTPIDLVTDRSGKRILGYTMEFLDTHELLIRYAEKSFRNLGVDNNSVVLIFRDLWDSVSLIHAQQTVLGDFNDLNVMVRGLLVKLIDADSFQFDKYLCKTFTAKFVDPKLCLPNPIGSGLTLSQPHNTDSDWYAFNVMLMQCLLFLDSGPYGGVYRPKNKNKRINHSERWKNRITVFDPETVYPKPSTHYSVLPDDILHYWHDLFVKDKRGPFPQNMLKSLLFTSCSCGTTHARQLCPKCQALGTVQPTEVTKIDGKVKVISLFQKKGVILYSTVQNGVLRYIYHDGVDYRREDDGLIANGALNTQMRFRICGEDTLIGQNGSVVVLNDGKVKTRFNVDSVGVLPIFDANQMNRFWASGRDLRRSNETLGIESSELVGTILQNQTQFWVGPKFGFGFYRAGNLSVAFVFDAKKNGINDKVAVDIRGQLIDSTCVFSDKFIWFLTSTKESSRIINRCYVIAPDGTVVAQANYEKGSEPLVDNIRGKLPFGNGVFVPTDDGLVRYDMKAGAIEKTREYPETSGILDSGDLLLPAKQGIYVVSSHEIKEIRLV